jgi:hypothetical protein
MKNTKILSLLIILLWITIAGFSYLSWFPLFQVLGIIAVIQSFFFIFKKARKNSFGLLISNITLFVLAISLFLVIAPISIIYTIFVVYFKFGFKIGNEVLLDYFLANAHSIDQSGNVTGMFLFSDMFLSSGQGKQYGNPDETISHVTGFKENEALMTWFGKDIAYFLNTADTNHTKKAIENTQINENIKEKHKPSSRK